MNLKAKETQPCSGEMLASGVEDLKKKKGEPHPLGAQVQ
jgi:hypothetical protein